MTLRPLRLATALLAGLFLAGCETPAPEQTLPQLSFSHMEPFRLDLGRIEVVNEFVAPGKEPHIEHVMPLPPAAATERWVRDRLRPLGRAGTLRIAIREAKVVEVPLKVEKGWTDLFRKQQSERYDGALEIAMKVLDERQMPLAEIRARTERSRSVGEGISPNERERVWFELVEAMLRDMDGQLERLIREYMAQWLMAS